MSEMTTEDKAYADASVVALGKAIGWVYVGMIETGMTKDDALEVLIEYVKVLAANQTSHQ